MPSIAEFTKLLEEVVPEGTVGFATGSRLLEFFVTSQSGCLGHTGKVLELSSAYDVRVFTEEAQWHWRLNQRRRQGEITCLDDASATQRGWRKLKHIHSRLLRGHVVQKDGTWSLLHDSVTRPLWVPIEAQQRSLIRIGVVEYLSEDDHGNVGVAAERLTVLSEEAETNG